MGNIRVVTLEHINLEDMMEIWNRCWRGYYYDMSYTSKHMKVWLDLSQVSLKHSIALFVEDRVAGFVLLSVDGTDGWIAGTSIDPDYRCQGLFTPLMRTQLDIATCIGLKRVYLEVLEQNHARKVYQSVGFVQVRQLYVYRAQSRIDFSKKNELHPLEPIPVEHYFENRRRAFFNPTWQRREVYLRRHRHCFAVVNSAGTAGALFAGEKNAPLLDAWSATAAGAEDVISTAFQRSGKLLSLTNQPEDWITTYLSAYGINPSAKQFEMCVELT